MNSFYNSFDSIDENDPDLNDTNPPATTTQPELTKCVALYSYEVGRLLAV